MGLVDENRQRKPSSDVWRAENSPARIQASWTRDAAGRPIGFSATVERRGPGEIPSYDLRGYDAHWEVRAPNGSLVAQGKTALPVIGPPARVEGSWAAAPASGFELRLRVLRPTGFEAAASRIAWTGPDGQGR